jgi:sortase A
MILPEKYEEMDIRMNNAQWILPSVDERLTLISCWPFESNTHRVIIVARPLAREEITLDLE